MITNNEQRESDFRVGCSKSGLVFSLSASASMITAWHHAITHSVYSWVMMSFFWTPAAIGRAEDSTALMHYGRIVLYLIQFIYDSVKARLPLTLLNTVCQTLEHLLHSTDDWPENITGNMSFGSKYGINCFLKYLYFIHLRYRDTFHHPINIPDLLFSL